MAHAPSSLRRYAGEMRRSVSQISQLVDDLFEFAQLEAGAITVETRRARVREVVDSALGAVTHPAAAKRLRLVSDVDGVGDLTCFPRLERVLHNLLVNAVQHTPADGTVGVAATRRDRWLELAVEDAGAGIAPEDLTRVFEPFYRSDPARHRRAGSGLGLPSRGASWRRSVGASAPRTARRVPCSRCRCHCEPAVAACGAVSIRKDPAPQLRPSVGDGVTARSPPDVPRRPS